MFFLAFWSLGQKLESLLKICDYIMKQEEILIRKMVLQLKFRLMVFKKYMSENHEFCRIWLFYFKISWNILLAMHFSSKLKDSLKHLISHFLAIADWILRIFFGTYMCKCEPVRGVMQNLWKSNFWKISHKKVLIKILTPCFI